jgi:hypothetical protein
MYIGNGSSWRIIHVLNASSHSNAILYCMLHLPLEARIKLRRHLEMFMEYSTVVIFFLEVGVCNGNGIALLNCSSVTSTATTSLIYQSNHPTPSLNCSFVSKLHLQATYLQSFTHYPFSIGCSLLIILSCGLIRIATSINSLSKTAHVLQFPSS